MKILLITESHEELLVEESLRDGVISEDVMSIIDDASELVFGAIGFIPGAGEFVGDLPMLVKNILQEDYLGAAIFLVSMEPTPVSDTIAKALRAIQKIAKRTGQEERLNRMIGWLLEKTGGNQSRIVKDLFSKSKNKLEEIGGKVEDGGENEKQKKASGIIEKTIKFISDNLDKMEDALVKFLDLIDKRAEELDVAGGVDVPDEYVNYLTKEISLNYKRLLDIDTDRAILYKKKLKSNAQKRPEVKAAYESVFGPIPEIE